jgi:hypothetical protein
MADATLSLPLVGGQAQVPLRRCRRCHEAKPITDFAWKERGVRRSICRGCEAARQRADYARKPSRKAYQDRWRAVNSEKKRAYSRANYRRTRLDLRRAMAKTLDAKRAWCKRRGIECAISADDIVTLFNEQRGICALTGRSLVWGAEGVQRDTLSIDRIDQSRGYVLGNIRLVTYQANFARNRFSDEELFAVCEAVLATRMRDRGLTDA